MGFHTKYTLLKFKDKNGHELATNLQKQLLSKLEDHYEDFYYDLTNHDDTKWYSFTEDMVEVSKEFTDILFSIEYLDENDSQGIYYFLNGQWEHKDAIINYPESTLIKKDV